MTTRAIIQARIDDPTNRGFVPIEPGHIKLDRPLVVGHNRSVILQGSGPATILEADFDSAPAIDLQGATEGKREVDRVIRDMVITRGSNRRSDPITCGISATQQANLTLSGLVFLQHPWGIRAVAGTEWRISDCTFTFGCTNAIRFEKTINVYMTRCILEHTGIGLEATGNAHCINLSQCQIVNGYEAETSAEESGYAYGTIFDGGDANSVSQCVLEGARFTSIYFANKCKDSLVSNCWFGSAASRVFRGLVGGTGILADPGSERLTIANNRFGGQRAPAIALDRVRNLIIQANRFEDNCRDDSAAHLDLFGCTIITIANNSFEECQAKSAIRFQAAGAGNAIRNRSILISGNDFALLNGSNGQVVRRALAGASTVDSLVHSGNMLGSTPLT